jgi:cyclopropane fatty-acyl-phospholipid synthase-like methyltransferase
MGDQRKSLIRRAQQRALRAGRKITGEVTGRSSTQRRHGLVGPADLWAMKRRFQFEFLTSRGLRPEHRLIDVGCGALRGGIPLIEYLDTGHYTGIEARAAVLDEGRKELAEAGLEHKRPLLIQATDPAQVELDAPFDVAWAFMVLIHMTDEIVDACLGLVASGLTEAGEFYANVNLGSNAEAQWQDFPVVWRPRQFYEDLAAPHGLIVHDVGTLESLGHGSAGDMGMMLRFAWA